MTVGCRIRNCCFWSGKRSIHLTATCLVFLSVAQTATISRKFSVCNAKTYQLGDSTNLRTPLIKSNGVGGAIKMAQRKHSNFAILLLEVWGISFKGEKITTPSSVIINLVNDFVGISFGKPKGKDHNRDKDLSDDAKVIE